MKSFLNKLASSLRRFMYGRYGLDQLGYAILISYSIILIITSFVRQETRYIDYFLVILLVIFYYRIFSKKIVRRAKENAIFMRFYNPIRSLFRKKATRIKKMKEYRYFRCPQCKNELKVPKGKGKIEITCPSCHHHFDRKS